MGMLCASCTFLLMFARVLRRINAAFRRVVVHCIGAHHPSLLRSRCAAGWRCQDVKLQNGGSFHNFLFQPGPNNSSNRKRGSNVHERCENWLVSWRPTLTAVQCVSVHICCFS